MNLNVLVLRIFLPEKLSWSWIHACGYLCTFISSSLLMAPPVKPPEPSSYFCTVQWLVCFTWLYRNRHSGWVGEKRFRREKIGYAKRKCVKAPLSRREENWVYFCTSGRRKLQWRQMKTNLMIGWWSKSTCWNKIFSSRKLSRKSLPSLSESCQNNFLFWWNFPEI